jgi:phage FluMu protein Com
MPIRFRCHSCNQLLGIARRKIGMQVRCPTCRKMLTVPKEDGADKTPDAEVPPLFERDDFEALLHGPNQPATVGSASPPPAPSSAPIFVPPRKETPPTPVYESELVSPVASPSNEPTALAGIVLSPGLATILTVSMILLLAIAFGAGLLIGRFALQ